MLFGYVEFRFYDSRHAEYFELKEAVKNNDKKKMKEIKRDLDEWSKETYPSMMKDIVSD